MTTRLELQNYLQEKKVEEILSEVVQEVLRDRPTDVIPYMMQALEKMKAKYGGGQGASKSAAAPAAASAASAAAPAVTVTSPPAAATAAAVVEPYFLPESPLDTDSDVENRMALMGRRYSQARTRRVAVSSGHEDDEDEEFVPKVVPKSAEAEERIARAVEGNFLFNHLDEKQRRIIFDALFESHATPGETIIQQGEEGDNFYIIDSGVVEIFKEIDGKETKVLQLGPGGAFGELALMYNCPRQATVKASTEVHMWALDRKTYRHIMLDTTMKKRKLYEQFLQSVPLLETLSNYERATIADALHEVRYNDGDVIVREGEPGDNFYIIEEGNVVVTKSVDGKPVKVAELHASDYFGELALLNNAPRAATVTASGSVKCVSLDRSSFVRLLGPCEEIMKRKEYTTPDS